jgi:hypothetical protein
MTSAEKVRARMKLQLSKVSGKDKTDFARCTAMPTELTEGEILNRYLDPNSETLTL